jgi:hypothetical protein
MLGKRFWNEKSRWEGGKASIREVIETAVKRLPEGAVKVRAGQGF